MFTNSLHLYPSVIELRIVIESGQWNPIRGNHVMPPAVLHVPNLCKERGNIINGKGYISVTQCASDWCLSIKYIQMLCRQGKIEGAIKENGKWLIPEGAVKPEDKRVTSGKYKGWRKKYNVYSKIDGDLQKMIDEVNKNARQSETTKEKKKKLVLITNK